MRLGLFILTMLLLDGHGFANGVDGGGDPFLQKLYRLKAEAVARLNLMDQRWVFKGDKDVVDFLLAKQMLDDLATDLSVSLVELRPNEVEGTPNPNGKCAFTKQEAKAPIYFSKNFCVGVTDEQLIATFYNEAVHHAGKDNAFAAKASNAVHDAYLKGPPIFGRWEKVVNGKKIELWIGREIKDDQMQVRLVTNYIRGLYIDLHATAFDLKTGEIKIEGFVTQRDDQLCRFPLLVSTKFSHDYGFVYFDFRVSASADTACVYKGATTWADFRFGRDASRRIQSYLQGKTDVPSYYKEGSDRYIWKYLN